VVGPAGARTASRRAATIAEATRWVPVVVAQRPAATPKLLDEIARLCPPLLRSVSLLVRSPTRSRRPALGPHPRQPCHCSGRPRLRTSAGWGTARLPGAVPAAPPRPPPLPLPPLRPRLRPGPAARRGQARARARPRRPHPGRGRTDRHLRALGLGVEVAALYAGPSPRAPSFRYALDSAQLSSCTLDVPARARLLCRHHRTTSVPCWVRQ
jgi:hypothetical protein